MKTKRVVTWIPKDSRWRCTVCRFQGRVLSIEASSDLYRGTAVCPPCARAIAKAVQPNGDGTKEGA